MNKSRSLLNLVEAKYYLISGDGKELAGPFKNKTEATKALDKLPDEYKKYPKISVLPGCSNHDHKSTFQGYCVHCGKFKVRNR